jgi:flagellar hook-associated protein 3 FlgL
MELRHTVGTQVANVTANMQMQTAGAAFWQQRISSGIKLAKPSDGASDFVTLIDYKSRDQRLGNYQSAIADATSTLNDGVTHLTEAAQILTLAHNAASEGANASADEKSYEALAANIDAYINRMVDVANGKSGGRYLFGGTATTKAPFSVTGVDAVGRPTGIAYGGSDERSQGIIGANLSVDTTYSGNRVFQNPGTDVFQTLLTLRDDLRNPALTQPQRAAQLNQHMQSLDGARNYVLSSVGEQSSALENMEALRTRIDDVRINVQGRVGELEGTDFAEAAVKFQEQQNALNATLAVTAKIFEVSLLDFMR